jgi:hypothetical protein
MTKSSLEIEQFVTKGLLPENIPPVFTTKNLWAPLSQYASEYTITKKSIGEHATYNASKRGGQRRIFSIPHPSFIRDKAIFFQKHWTRVTSLIESSPGSASRPTFHTTGPRHQGCSMLLTV